jgi:hypothetical protein
MDRTRYVPPKNEQSDFYLNEDSNRLFIERHQVVDTRYKVLLFPLRTGESLPVSTWNANRTELTIDIGEGCADIFTFERHPAEHRTKVTLRQVSPQTPQ